MITVNFYTTLRLMLKLKELQIELDETSSISRVLIQIEEKVVAKTGKNFLWKLLDDDNSIKRGTIIMINGVNILDSQGLNCPVSPDDIVALFPPGGGG